MNPLSKTIKAIEEEKKKNVLQFHEIFNKTLTRQEIFNLSRYIEEAKRIEKLSLTKEISKKIEDVLDKLTSNDIGTIGYYKNVNVEELKKQLEEI